MLYKGLKPFAAIGYCFFNAFKRFCINSQSNYANSQPYFNNSQLNYENSHSNYGNSQVYYDNSQLNYAIS
jgi:hypothetical protein